MKYFVYNATKNVRLPGEFEYRDALFSRSSLGRILRMLLDTEWAGDRIAIMPTDKWEADKDNLLKAGIKSDPLEADIQSIVFMTYNSTLPEYVCTDDAYVKFNAGSIYNVDRDHRIDRFDTLIPLITIDPPEHLYETYYVDINGKWVFEPLHMRHVNPETEDLSAKYDIETFYKDYPDELINRNLSKFGEISDDGLWVGDLIGVLEN